MALKESYDFAPHDPRTDMGYGRLSAKFQKPRSFLQYDDQEDYQEENFEDDDTYEAVLSKILNYGPTDPYSKNKSDPFHFVDSASKLSELSTTKGMVPFPKMYKDRTASGTGGSGASLPHAGPTYGFRSNTRPTGTKKGFSSAPKPIDSLQDVTGPNYSLEDIIFGDSDIEHLERTEKLIQNIHLEQE